MFYLSEIIDEYFKGTAAEPAISNALREFSWLYAGFPRLWGYYNSIINTIFFFIINSTRDYITEPDLKYFDFTNLDTDDVLNVLFETKALKPPKSGSRKFEMGELSRILSRKIRDELTTDTGHFKEKSEELFGITSIILTHILIKRKLKNADESILPRKAFSLFLTFTHIILDNYDPSVNISEEVDRDLFEKQQKIIKVSKNTQLKFLLEMLGLSYISPGIPNIIDGFGDSDKVLKLKKTMINFLELLRERRRERVRTRLR